MPNSIIINIRLDKQHCNKICIFKNSTLYIISIFIRLSAQVVSGQENIEFKNKLNKKIKNKLKKLFITVCLKSSKNFKFRFKKTKLVK